MISERMKKAGLVGLDTSPFIFYLEENPLYLDLCDEIFNVLERKEAEAVTSTISLIEVLVRPFSLENTKLVSEYRAFFTNIPNLTIVSLDESLAEKSAKLRAKYRIRTPDSIQIAAAIESGAPCFITNDEHFEKLSDEIEIIVLSKLKSPKNSELKGDPHE